MGKGKRSRQGAISSKELKMQKLAEERKRKRKNFITSSIVFGSIIAVAALGILSAVLYNNANNNGNFVRNKVALKTENHSISTTVMQYFYNSAIRNFEEDYADSLTSMGLDTSSDLKNQASYFDPKQTWHDYFIDTAKDQAEEVLIMCEAANEAGIELDDYDKKSIEDSLESISEAAKTSDMSEEEYIDSIYGSWVNKKDIEKAIELTTLASKYYDEYNSSLEFSDKQINKQYVGNKDLYYKCDYIYLNNISKAEAEELVAIKDKADFTKAVKDSLKKSIKAQNPDYSNTQVNSEVTQKFAACNLTDVEYFDTDEKGLWLFDAKRKAGDTTIFKDDANKGKYIVCYLVNPVKKDKSVSKNVRHILFSIDNFENDKECKLEAEKIFKEWKNGKKTEKEFAALAKEHSQDPGSKSIGGIYKNVTKGTMVEEFENWLFKKGRKVGDADIVKTDYGYHIMYFVGNGYEAWQVEVTNDLAEKEYQNHLEELKEKFEIQEKDKNITIVNQIFTEKESEVPETDSTVQ